MNGLPVTFFAGTILYSYLWEAFTEFSETTVAHYTLHWAVVPKNCSFKEHRLLKKLAHHPEIFFIPFSKKKTHLFIHSFGCAGSSCIMRTLNCGMWDLVPCPRNLGLLHWDKGILATGSPGKSLILFYLKIFQSTLVTVAETRKA